MADQRSFAQIQAEMQARGPAVYEAFRQRLNVVLNRDGSTALVAARKVAAEMLATAAAKPRKKITLGRIV